MPRFVIPDIHGCAQTLQTLLDRIGIKPGHVFYFLGDYIDRGPGSKEVLDIILDIRDRGVPVECLKGNHEAMLLGAYDDPSSESAELWVLNGGLDALESFRVTMPQDIPARYITFLQNLPEKLVLDDIVLAHAGLNFSYQNPVEQTPSHDLLWIRNYTTNAKKLAGKRLITGHTPRSIGYIRQSLTGPHVELDNCCFRACRGSKLHRDTTKGNLVALCVETNELIIQPCLD